MSSEPLSTEITFPLTVREVPVVRLSYEPTERPSNRTVPAVPVTWTRKVNAWLPSESKG